MSGICGIVRTGDQPLTEDALNRMMRAMQNLGPDAGGCWHNESAGLGHQMMHITPESLYEILPFYDSECQIALTADARLDNRDELLNALNISLFSGIPDSIVLLKSYQKWGEGCASHLVGEFAFVIWDAREQCLHCFTDPMGIRPLFYTELPGQFFAFASEVTALLAFHNRQVAINERRLAMLGVSAMSVYLEPEATCFKGIYRVPAASILTMKNGRKRCSEYWRPDVRKRLRFKSDDECREAFQEVFFQAVKARLRSAFPVASLLSGGLDSSGIVGAASEILAEQNKSLITLSAVPQPNDCGSVTHEMEFIDLFKDRPNLEMRYITAPGCGPFDELDCLFQTASLCSYSFQHFLYTAFVRAAKKDNARVILDGHGGEFSASGRSSGYMAEQLLSGRWKSLISELRHFDANQRVKWPIVKRQVLRPLFPYALLKVLNRHSRFKNLVQYPVHKNFVRDVLGGDIAGIKDALFQSLVEFPNHRRNMVLDIQWEQRDLRQRGHAGFVDYHEAQYSYPYLDKRMLEFGLATDGQFKFKDGYDRRLIRLGMQGVVPQTILKRTDKGPFSPDYHLRYQTDKFKAASILKRYCGEGNLNTIVDFAKVMPALEHSPIYRPEKPMQLEYESQFLVPYAVYLCYFMNTYTRQDGLTGVQ